MRTDILTSHGRYFDFVNLERNRLSIEEVASSLSKLCRFTGHCRELYSVAQHSVLVSQVVPRQYAMAGLLHDAAEAVLGDVAAPLKQLLPDYKAIERRVEPWVFAQFGLPGILPPEVKHADRVLLATERRDLMPPTDDLWEHHTQGVQPLAMTVVPLAPERARRLFLDRYAELLRAADADALCKA